MHTPVTPTRYPGLDGTDVQPALRGAPTSNQESDLAFVAALIYGPDWRRKLAQATGRSYRTVLRWSAGKAPTWVFRFLEAVSAKQNS